MEGKLSGFTLPEVMELLALKKRTGVLNIEAGPEEVARIWMQEGSLAKAQTPALSGAGADCEEGEALERLEEAVLEILDWREGVYSFAADKEDTVPAKMVFDVAAVVRGADKRRAEWAKIRKEIPSLKARVVLVSQIEVETVGLSRTEWQIVSMVGKGVVVEDIQRTLECTPLVACRALLALADKGLLRCLGEVKEDGPIIPAAAVETATKGLSKKYVRKSLLADDTAGAVVPAEWLSYYQLLDSRTAAANGRREGKLAKQ